MQVANGRGMSWWRLRLVRPRPLLLRYLPVLTRRPGLPSPCRDRWRGLLWTLLLWTLLLLLLLLPQWGLQHRRRSGMGDRRLQWRLGVESRAWQGSGIC
jgi:hypothetical protein